MTERGLQSAAPFDFRKLADIARTRGTAMALRTQVRSRLKLLRKP